MTTDTASLETVLLETARPVDAAALGRVLGGLLGLAPPDAARRARYCGGIVLESVAPALAADALAELKIEGLGARRVPAAAVPPLAKPRALGLRPVEVPEDVRLAIAFALDAGVPPARAQTLDPESLLAGEDHGHDEPTVRLLGAIARRRRDERRETVLGVDLVTADRRVLRYERSAVTLIPSVRPALAALPPGAIRAPETDVLLAAGALEPALFLHAEELARYERWLLARVTP